MAAGVLPALIQSHHMGAILSPRLSRISVSRIECYQVPQRVLVAGRSLQDEFSGGHRYNPRALKVEWHVRRVECDEEGVQIVSYRGTARIIIWRQQRVRHLPETIDP